MRQRKTSLLTSQICMSPSFHSFSFFRGWPGSRPERVSEPAESQKAAVSSLFGGSGAADQGRTREGKQDDDRQGKGDDDERRNGFAGRRKEGEKRRGGSCVLFTNRHASGLQVR